MGMSEYVRGLREKVGHALILSPGVAGIVFNARGEVLLQRRIDNGRWGLPGGAMDPGEEPAESVEREVFEETGVRVRAERIVGVYAGPNFRFKYPNGDEIAVVSITFACTPVGGEPQVNDDECLDVRYFALDALPELYPLDLERILEARRNRPEAFFRPPAPGSTPADNAGG